ncbi:MAG: T9SS type A sorting domain-containing protein [Sporocytophaga sp.]|uniref:DUF7619 domain-containing protein n=1 Tax=Sporocytophaga sp. TaxID=2231183 RepID=UPI001B16D4D8|nr:T9SS type A sorting domain-containing protein [Sporocytophaga sp.]MBO9700604.1 T9SS type A sorting domain-containing protein [Sporocytophaga sp.]
MKINLLVFLLAFLYSTIPSQGQNNIAYGTPYEMSVTNGSLYSWDNKKFEYTDYCPLYNPRFYFKKQAWPVEVYSIESTIPYPYSRLVYSSYGQSVSEFSALLYKPPFYYNPPYVIIANGRDTLAYITKIRETSSQVINSIGLERRSPNNNIEVFGDTILFCSSPANNYFPIRDLISPFGGESNWSSFNYSSKFIINNIELPSTPTIGQLKDGDTLQIEINDIKPYYEFSYPCLDIKGPVRSKKYIIRKGNIGTYSFPEKIINICPGDTVFPVKDKSMFSRLTYKTIDNNFFLSDDQTQQNRQFYKPVTITGVVFEQGIGKCWSKADTVKYVNSSECKYGYVSGSVFYDKNINGIMEYDEKLLTNKLIKIEPDNKVIYTVDGNFKGLMLPIGQKHSLSISDENWGSGKIDIDMSRSDTFHYYSSVNIPGIPLVQNDLQVEITAGRMRPGFPTTYFIDIRNNGNNYLYDTYIDLTLDTTLKGITFGTAPLSINNNKVRWKINYIDGQAKQRFIVNATIPINLSLLGNQVSTSVEITNPADTYLANNKDIEVTTITGSFDPNDKQVSSENGKEAAFIPPSSGLEYVIRFQNTGTDTAFIVKVIDTLSSNHDVKTLKILAASHNYDFTVNDNILIWTFKNILLPDSTTNEPKSQGFVKFTIKPNPEISIPAEVTNKAYIYFDFNEPVITNTTKMLIADDLVVTGTRSKTKTDQILIYPNPAHKILNLSQRSDFIIESLSGQILLNAYDVNIIDISHLHKGMYLLKTKEGGVSKFMVE